MDAAVLVSKQHDILTDDTWKALEEAIATTGSSHDTSSDGLTSDDWDDDWDDDPGETEFVAVDPPFLVTLLADKKFRTGWGKLESDLRAKWDEFGLDAESWEETWFEIKRSSRRKLEPLIEILAPDDIEVAKSASRSSSAASSSKRRSLNPADRLYLAQQLRGSPLISPVSGHSSSASPVVPRRMRLPPLDDQKQSPLSGRPRFAGRRGQTPPVSPLLDPALPSPAVAAGLRSSPLPSDVGTAPATPPRVPKEAKPRTLVSPRSSAAVAMVAESSLNSPTLGPSPVALKPDYIRLHSSLMKAVRRKTAIPSEMSLAEEYDDESIEARAAIQARQARRERIRDVAVLARTRIAELYDGLSSASSPVFNKPRRSSVALTEPHKSTKRRSLMAGFSQLKQLFTSSSPTLPSSSPTLPVSSSPSSLKPPESPHSPEPEDPTSITRRRSASTPVPPHPSLLTGRGGAKSPGPASPPREIQMVRKGSFSYVDVEKKRSSGRARSGSSVGGTRPTSGTISRTFSKLFVSGVEPDEADWELPTSPKTTLRRVKAASPFAAIPWQERVEPGLILMVDPAKPKDPPLVKGGTPKKLIERLTYEGHPDTTFVVSFLLTYRSFMSAGDLLQALLDRYQIAPPPDVVPVSGDSPELAAEKAKAMGSWTQEKQIPIQLRVVNVLKLWVERHTHDFRDDAKLVSDFKTGLKTVIAKGNFPKPAEHLETTLTKLLERGSSRRGILSPTSIPAPEIPPFLDLSKASLLDLHPKEIARQMTLLEHDMYKTIQPKECLSGNWRRKAKEELAPNIVAMIKRFNLVSRWVASMAVRPGSAKERAIVINRFIAVADFCLALNNFNSLMAILAGLQHPAVLRLKRSWSLLSSKMLQVWQMVHKLMDYSSNMKAFRDYLRHTNPPALPYLGVYLTDLTFIADGNVDILEPSGYINFAKHQKIASVIRDLQQYQNQSYALATVPHIAEYLTTRLLDDLIEESELFPASLAREPRRPRPPSSRG